MQLLESEYIDAARLHTRLAFSMTSRAKQLLTVFVLMTIAIIGVVIASMIERGRPITLSMVMLLLALPTFYGSAILLVFSSRFLVFPRQLRRKFQEVTQLSSSSEYEITAETFETKNELGSQRIPLLKFTHWIESEGLFLLYLTSSIYVILPVRCLESAEQAERLRAILRVAVPGSRPSQAKSPASSLA